MLTPRSRSFLGWYSPPPSPCCCFCVDARHSPHQALVLVEMRTKRGVANLTEVDRRQFSFCATLFSAVVSRRAAGRSSASLFTFALVLFGLDLLLLLDCEGRLFECGRQCRIVGPFCQPQPRLSHVG